MSLELQQTGMTDSREPQIGIPFPASALADVLVIFDPQPEAKTAPVEVLNAGKALRVELDQFAGAINVAQNPLLVLAEKQQRFIAARVERDRLSSDDSSIARLEQMYEAISAEIPKDQGRVRMISLSELHETLRFGSMATGSDFAFAGEGARVGHNTRFICVACKPDSTVRFVRGPQGSSEINSQPIPLADLVLFIPRMPKANASAVLKPDFGAQHSAVA